jgi:hypothetical protein
VLAFFPSGISLIHTQKKRKKKNICIEASPLLKREEQKKEIRQPAQTQ